MPRTPLHVNAEVMRAPTAKTSLKLGTRSFKGKAGAELTACVPGVQRFLQEHGEVQMSALGLGAYPLAAWL